MVGAKKKRLGAGWVLLFVILGLSDFALILKILLRNKNIALFAPKGLIANQQHSLMMYVVLVLLIIALPALFTLFYTAWKYRESNTKAKYKSDGRRGKSFVVVMWVIPTTFMLIIASAMFPATHKLAPQKSLDSDVKPLTIQVISLRWKWLFIYPDQQIATVNFVQIPVNTPVQFEMTADETPMSSFWIPNLGGQLYTMTSHVNSLNLKADTIGDYPGSTPEINGAGFTGMKFTTRVSDSNDFDHWVSKVQQSTNILDSTIYEGLLKPSENNPIVYYSAYVNNLYNNVIIKYQGPGGHAH